MPRANRYFLAGYIWHITHRCHQRAFLLKFARDRRRWIHWLFEARKRFGLRILNYIATCNHVHLLVQDQGRGEIPNGMQLAAGRVAQEYNQRKSRRGAFWEDRYHATAVDSDGYLARCLTYIDLNMVRAGAVDDPIQWPQSGYYELNRPPVRYRVIDNGRLLELLGFSDLHDLREARANWAQEAIGADQSRRPEWSRAIAIGSRRFVDEVKTKLGHRSAHRSLRRYPDAFALAEPTAGYRAASRQEGAFGASMSLRMTISTRKQRL